MASIKQIQQRRKAVNNVFRITQTMEMVSTAKYKAYYEKWIATVDFHDALAQAAYLLMTSEQPVEHRLLQENSSQRYAVLAIGSGRGLCGTYNSKIYRLVEEHVRRAKSLDKKIDIYCPEGKLVHYLGYHGITPSKVYEAVKNLPTPSYLEGIAQEFIDQYEAGQLDYFGVVYMRFHSATNQHAQTLTIMPLGELIDDLVTRPKIIWPWNLKFEDFYLSPPANEVIEDLSKMIIRSSIQNCFMEAIISEHLARMVAMRTATENAQDMAKELTNEYNRARQTQITGELLDIIGGSGVL